MSLDLTQYSNLAQIITAVITFIGLLVSMWLSVKALREVQIDRTVRQKPHLVFEIGGWPVPIEFLRSGKAIPGVNPAYVSKMFPNLPDDAESIRIKGDLDENGRKTVRLYGKLINCGFGPALSTEVTWVPKKVKIGSEEFEIDDKKRLEPLYNHDLNSMPTIPSFILPNTNAELSRLPTFIEKDFEKKINKVEGVLEITCKDLSGNDYTFKQEFFIFMKYIADKNSPPNFHVTFSDPETPDESTEDK